MFSTRKRNETYYYSEQKQVFENTNLSLQNLNFRSSYCANKFVTKSNPVVRHNPTRV